MKINWKLILAVVLIAAGATGRDAQQEGARPGPQGLEAASRTAHGEPSALRDRSWTEAPKSKEPWDRTVSLTQDQIQAIGLETTPVQDPDRAPLTSPLFGITDYDPATVTTVRLQFDSRVDKVLVDLGTVIEKGDPLLELFSTDLAAAKSDYELAVSQYNHDKNVYDYKKPLAKANTLARKELIEIENDQAQSQLKMKLAKDKLLVYGLTEQEIQAAKNEDGKEKAKMILRARADGVVVKRDVVPGNYYDSKDDAADHRPAGSPLGARGRQRARRRQGRGRPEGQGHLPLLPTASSRARSITSTRRSIPTPGRPSSAPRSPTPRGRSRPAPS